MAAGHGSGRSVATHRVARAAAPKAHKRLGKSLAALGQSPLRVTGLAVFRLCGGLGNAPNRPSSGRGCLSEGGAFLVACLSAVCFWLLREAARPPSRASRAHTRRLSNDYKRLSEGKIGIKSLKNNSF